MAAVYVRRGGGVYLLRALEGGLWKLGRSERPRARRRAVSADERPCELVHVVYVPRAQQPEVEWWVHHRYAHARVQGEWFALSPGEVAEVCSWAEAPTALMPGVRPWRG
jgi:hypothetical protein